MDVSHAAYFHESFESSNCLPLEAVNSLCLSLWCLARFIVLLHRACVLRSVSSFDMLIRTGDSLRRMVLIPSHHSHFLQYPSFSLLTSA